MGRLRDGFRSRSLTSLIVGLCAGTAVIVGAIFSILLISTIGLRAENASARRASDLVESSSTAEQSLLDLETGLRGYLITRERAFLVPYLQARAQLPGELAGLRGLAENQLGRYQVNRISRSISSYISGYAEPLIATGGRLSHAQAVRVTAQGKPLVDRLRLEFRALTSTELALRDRKRAITDARSRRAVAVAAAGLGASVVLLLALAGYLLLRFLRPVRSVAEAAKRLAGGELDARVPEVGMGEVALLGRSFNTMAAQLQSRDRELTRAREQTELALEEAREASVTKSNFLANMSHEIRTPLNGVIGMMDLLSETPLNHEQAEYVSVARSSGEALMVVVNDVLDIAKIEAGRLELEDREFDLHEVAEAACDMVAATSASKGLDLQSFVHDDVPAVVRGDRMRMGQILANLLSNAVKFTPQGEVVLEVALRVAYASKVEVRFEVRDTGIGIAQDRLAQLFEPFTQAEAGITRTYGGTGLGLAIVRELTEMMGGTVDVQSQIGKGSSFACMIPFEVAQRASRQPLPSELRGLNVLIVDDNATNRRIFEAYVASWGMHPVTADDGEDARAKLEQAAERGNPFHVVLLDFHMPGEDGIELANRIRSEPRLRRTKLILLTSSGESWLGQPATTIDYLLTKPVRQSRLLDAIGAVLTEGSSTLPAGAAAEEATPRETAPARSRRILVAEDQAVNWMLVQRLLEKRGHSASNAADGRQALEMFESDLYDLVLMDCQMPLMDGYGAAREMRRREIAEGRRHVPIVAMTANALEGDRELCLAAGMDDYLAKPITTAGLDQVLARWLPADGEASACRLDPGKIAELHAAFAEDEMAELFERLQREVNAQLQRIAGAVEAEDGADASAAAHRILSSARMIGAAALADTAIELQTSVRNDLGKALHLEMQLRQRWVAACATLEEALLGPSGSGA